MGVGKWLAERLCEPVAEMSEQLDMATAAALWHRNRQLALQDENKDLRGQLDLRTEKHKAATEHVRSLVVDKVKLAADLAHSEKERRNLVLCCQDAANGLKRRDGEITRLQGDITHLRRALAGGSHVIEGFQAKVESQGKMLEFRNSQIQTQAKSIVQLQKEKATLESLVDAQGREIDALREQIKKKAATIVEYQEKCEARPVCCGGPGADFRAPDTYTLTWGADCGGEEAKKPRTAKKKSSRRKKAVR
jgi:chromosome segregation ATPase